MRFSGIEEVQPANISDSAAGFLLIQLVLLSVLFFRSQRLPAPGQFILVLVSAFAGLAVVKFLPFAIITAAAMLVVWWRDEVRPSQSKIVEGLDLLQSKFMRLQSGTIGAIAFMLGCFAWINGYQLLMRPINFEATPKRAVDFIEQIKAEHPVLNGFDSGGYLIYRWSSIAGVPAHLVALDGRTNVNPPDVWKSYLSALNGDERWHSFIDKVGAKTILWRMKTPLVSLLLESPNWCRVFQSGSSVRDYAVFISREQFDLRRGEFKSSDCQ